jgi:hypothetical protein
MRWPLFALTSACLLAACSDGKPEIVALQKINVDPESWNGKTVRVDGWLATCSGYDCLIAPTKEDLDLIYHGCPGPECERALAAGDHLVSIGGDGNFDRAANPLEGKHVLLTATINAGSWHDCLDRCDALQPISIEAYPD